MPKYTDLTAIENYLLIEIDPTFEDQVDEWIVAAETYIERFTGRIFKTDAAASERTFNGTGEGTLYIPDASVITKVMVDDVELDADEYYAQPDSEGVITSIIYKYGSFRSDYGNVKITAKWGYGEEAPADIKFAATVLAAGIVNGQLNKSSTTSVQSETIGRYSVSYATSTGTGSTTQATDFDNVKNILKSYRRITF